MAAKAMVVCSSGLPHVGSEASSPAASPSASSKVVGIYSLEGVPVQWDYDPEIRERIRNNNSLVLSCHLQQTGACGMCSDTLACFIPYCLN